MWLMCQLCKRLTRPIIPHSWSGLVWKRVSPLDVIDHRAHSTAIYVYWAIFSMVPPNQKNKQTNNQVFLVKAWSWRKVKRQSVAIVCCCGLNLFRILCYLEKKLKGFRLKQFVTFSEKKWWQRSGCCPSRCKIIYFRAISLETLVVWVYMTQHECICR